MFILPKETSQSKDNDKTVGIPCNDRKQRLILLGTNIQAGMMSNSCPYNCD